MYIEDWQSKQRQAFIEDLSVGLYRVDSAAESTNGGSGIVDFAQMTSEGGELVRSSKPVEKVIE